MAPLAGFTALVATRIQDNLGNLCGSAAQPGTLNILPTDANDQPIGTTAGGVGGPIASTFAAPIPIVNGALPANAQVADVSLTLNAFISYRFVFKDSLGQTFLTWTKVQPTGASFNLDTYTVPNPVQAPYTKGPAGPQGPGGLDTSALHVRGPYVSGASYKANDLVSFNGVLYVGIADNPGAAAVPASPAHISPNLFNPATAVTGIQVGDINNGSVGGVDSGFTGYHTSAHMAVTPGTVYTLVWGAGDSNNLYGSVWWDANNHALLEVPIPYGNGATFTAPPNAATITITANNGPASTQQFGVMVAASAGSPAVPSQPPSNAAFWQPFLASSGTTDTAATHYKGQFSSSGTYAPGDLVSYGTQGSFLNILATASSGATQLFDPAAAVTGIQVGATSNNSVGGVDSNFSSYHTSAHMPVIPGTSYSLAWGASDSNGLYGSVWWDASGHALLEAPIPYANGATFTAPANANTITITANDGPRSSQMFIAGPLPSSYVPFGQSAASAALPTDTTHWIALGVTALPTVPASTYSPLNGKKIGVLGDSISSSLFGFAWENVVIADTGATFPFIDARPGRNFTQAFECYGVTAIGTNMNPASGAPTNKGSVSTPNGNYANNGTAGNTLAQDLAGIDIQVLYLGTNDQGYSLGAPGDAVTVDTQYGHIRWVVESLLAAKPTIRLVLLTVQYNGFGNPVQTANTANATVTIATSYGLPVLNLNQVGGVNALTAGVLLQGDGVHPSTFAFNNVLGPAIARFLERFAGR